ncbi:DUF4383 domain-containing protein [Actinoplanes sp. N902-109]|uniref:DUF4383 domain-containing protein n=1 Tax=Actinoplanes sp. (strain N902-109) TaxID=649831 RepID=UPI0003295C96|nr:DUF4383 domain-containing protein [Actinoplanes sp. N902-109]AGL21068.1 hypothetical protein L083_7558 [Actinoplanes sp. N902-109]
MAHYPLNHHLRTPYRLLAGVAGLYLTLAGILGIAVSSGDDFFGRVAGDWALGLRFNPAGAWVTTLLGVAVLVAAARGGNAHHRANVILGWALIGVAMVMLAVIQTDANILDFSMVNVIVVTLIGLAVLTAGLYGKVGSEGAEHTEQDQTRAAV